MSRIYAWFRLAHFSTGKQRAASITVASWLSVRPQTVAECSLTQTGYTLSSFVPPPPCRAASLAAEPRFRFGNGEHAARGIRAREARAGATGAGADAASSGGLQRTNHEVSAGQDQRSSTKTSVSRRRAACVDILELVVPNRNDVPCELLKYRRGRSVSW
jgi:hypothetical protein